MKNDENETIKKLKHLKTIKVTISKNTDLRAIKDLKIQRQSKIEADRSVVSRYS